MPATDMAQKPAKFLRGAQRQAARNVTTTSLNVCLQLEGVVGGGAMLEEEVGIVVSLTTPYVGQNYAQNCLFS